MIAPSSASILRVTGRFNFQSCFLQSLKMITIRIQIKPKKDTKALFVNITTVVCVLILLKHLPLQKTPFITRKQIQLVCSSGNLVGAPPFVKPLNFGTPFDYCGGKSFATMGGTIHHICMKEQGHIPFLDFQDEPSAMDKYKLLNHDYPMEIKMLKRRDMQHVPIPIFLVPHNQTSKSLAEVSKQVTNAGDWKVPNINFERHLIHDKHDFLSTVNFSFYSFDEDACNKTCYEMKEINFDDPESGQIDVKIVPSSGEDENLTTNDGPTTQDRVTNSLSPSLSDREYRDEVESMPSSIIATSFNSENLEVNNDSDRVSITDSGPEWARQLAKTTEPVRVKSKDIHEEHEHCIRAESSNEDTIEILKRENRDLQRQMIEFRIEHTQTKLQIKRLENLINGQLDYMRMNCNHSECELDSLSSNKRAKPHEE
jgi:hypothetical protein